MAADSVSRKQIYDLQDRLLDVAVLVSRVCESLPNSRIGKHVASQLVRCGTAPAPLHAEANAAESRKDFVHKLGLCLKELRETMSWLRYIDRLGIGDRNEVSSAITKTDRATAIIYSSIQTARRNDKLTS